MSAEGGQPSASASASASPSERKRPVVILVVGMAGTGKTTLVHRLQHYAYENGVASYFINLDPAVISVPYNANVDIRDTVDYKEVMRRYRLGPNGAILTSLNLFATKMHQVVSLLEGKEGLDWIVVDTPGQIEVFTWSASGQLISEALSATFPTVVLFVADTTRCLSPQTFVSTMLYSSGIMLKQQLPLLLVFNKIDVVSADVVIEWMRDPDALQDAVSNGYANHDGEGGGGGGVGVGVGAATLPLMMGDAVMVGGGATTAGYAGTLARSMALFLHEYYEDIPWASVSAASGAGMDSLRSAIDRAKAQSLEEKKREQERVKLQEERRLEKQQEAFTEDVRTSQNEEGKESKQ